MSIPAPDVIEISLIGPGYGESIIVHAGDGEWIIVDSCVKRPHEDGAESAATAYLREIGVDPGRQVSRVIASHWHDDHIGGLSRVVEDCVCANFCCAVALREEEFLGFAAVYAEADPSPIARSTREIIEILELLKERRKTPTFLVPDTLVLKTARNISMYALSPSNERIKEFLSNLAGKMPKLGATRRRMGDMRPNAIAVALFIDLGADAVLLGADVEETPGGGWSSIIVGSQAMRGRRSSVYKVAHHGSKSAECGAIWDTLLVPTPFAILTPFSLAGRQLPSEKDVDRILGRTPHSYSTARLTSIAPRRRDPSVERTIRESGWKIQAAEPKPGHVRLRRPLGASSGQWSVELMGNATLLEHIRH